MSDRICPKLEGRKNRGRSIMEVIWRAAPFPIYLLLAVAPFVLLYREEPLWDFDYIPNHVPYYAALLFIFAVFFIRIAVLELKSTDSTSYDLFESFFCIVSLIIGLIGTYAVIYRSCGLIDDTAHVTSPTDFLYFSIVTWTTLGYGDIKPTQLSRLFAASEALLGYIAMGLYLSLVFHAMSGRSKAVR